MLHIGIDAKPYWKKSSSTSFSSSLATSVVVSDYETFKATYSAEFQRILKKHNFSTQRAISKGFELQKMGVGPAVITELLTAAVTNIKQIFVHFVVFSLSDRNYKINMPEKVGFQELSIRTFLRNYLDNYFPYIPYWDFQTKKTELGDECTFYLDSFQGQITNAWEAIRYNKDFFVIPAGDKVNALISISDLFNHFITWKLLKSQKSLSVDLIKELIKEHFPNLKVDACAVSNWALYNIVPSEKGQIDCRKNWKKPLFCVIPEAGSKIPKKLIELSPHLNNLCNFVFYNDGSLKFLDINQDIPFLTEKDYLIYLGTSGEILSKELLNLGYKFQISHIKDIKPFQPINRV